MNAEDIIGLITEMDTANAVQSENAWTHLRGLGEDIVPFLAKAYPTFRKSQGRVALLFHALRYARSSECAFQLGLAALGDRATLVRYRACGLLAYSLRREALPRLTNLLVHTDSKTVDDAKAAIDAVQRQNHHYFVDRTHSGRSSWQVNEYDTAEPTDAAAASPGQ
jgi:hypothetical protein